MRKSSVFLLSAVVGLALVIPTQEAAAQQTRGNSDGAVTYHARIAYDTVTYCGAHRITIDGWVDIKVLRTGSASGNSNYAVIVNGKGVGVDASGNMYRWLLNRMQHNHDSAMSSQAVDVINSRARLIGQGDAPSYDYIIQTHYTINANGEATASFRNVGGTCKF
jgi:hypothetical protein